MKDQPSALPVYSVNTEAEAQRLIEKVGVLKWLGGMPQYALPHFDGNIESLGTVSEILEKLDKT